jgi:hypothetical protein
MIVDHTDQFGKMVYVVNKTDLKDDNEISENFKEVIKT